MKITLILFVVVAISYCYGAIQNITMLTTSYGFNDNSPPSAQISFPHSGGYPTLHNLATEGKGTYDDPITFATDQKEFGPGTRVYVVHLHKYFIMEDECEACDSDWKKGKYHIDLWMGPQHSCPEPALDNCEAHITQSNAVVIVNPPTNLIVSTTPLFDGTKCTAVIYPN